MQSDIFILTIAIIASIIFTIVKNKNLTKEKKIPTVAPGDSINTETIFSSDSVTSIHKTTTRNNQYQNTNNQLHKNQKGNSQIKSKTAYFSSKSNTEISSSDDFTDDILETFSIEKAIIYKEILTPKFKE